MNIQVVVPLQSHDAFTNPTDGNEPHTVLCPAIPSSLLEIAPRWHRKCFPTLLFNYMDVL